MAVEDLVRNGDVDSTSRYNSLHAYNMTGDFRFIVLEKVFPRVTSLSFINHFIIGYHAILKHFSLSDERSFGLGLSFVTVERVPLLVDMPHKMELKRLGVG